MTAGLARSVAVVAMTVALVAGCSAAPGAGEDTPTTAAGSGTESSGSPEAADPTGSGRPLDADALEQALPSPDDLGEDWADDPQGVIGEVETEAISPDSCAPLLFKGPDGTSMLEDHRARVQANYALEDSAVGDGSFMGIWAYSSGEALPSSTFDKAGTLVGSCASMEVTQTDTGSVSSYATTQLAFPNLGDKTLALRLKITQTLRTVTMDFVVIKVGHTTLFVANGDYLEEPDSAATERAARAAVQNVKEST